MDSPFNQQPPDPFEAANPQTVSGRCPLKLLEKVRNVLRIKHYSYRTEETYTHVLNKPGLAIRTPADTSVRLAGSP